VQRTDTAGGAAGLTATYTGKWDGTRFTDGKLTYAFKGASGTGIWTLTREVTPVVHTTLGTVQTVTQDEIYGVGRRPGMYYNWYTAELTGFAIDYRRSMLAALTGIGATLCTLGTRQSAIADVDAVLGQQQAAQDARSAADKGPRGAAYAYVGKILHGRGNGRRTASQITQRAWDEVNKLRSGLADPVKDSSGQPAFASVTPLACSWP
jgi:hypothetical protein